MDQYIGKMLDNRYEILECIGTGGMAVVYKARCHRLNRLVAVKILKPELASDADFRRRFHDESQAVAMLSNANIVSVYDVSHSDGLDYIVMELVDGMTLKQYMQKRGVPLNWREALHFITQIVRALSHAHSRGIIHRDIKPHNILVLRDGSVKVTDFGIAQLASAAQPVITQEAIGSVHYISPEQARGSHVDGRTDLYSAGVVLYEMLTGRLPFEGDTPVNIALQHISAIPIPPRELNPVIPPMLEAITMKAMAPELEERYASADEMLEALNEFRKNPTMQPQQTQIYSPDVVDEPTRVVPISQIANQANQNASSSQRQLRDASGEQRYREQQRQSEADMDNEPPRRRFPVAVVAVLAILLFVGGLGIFAFNVLFKDSGPAEKEYTVPKILGYTMEELEENPDILGEFTVKVTDTEVDSEYKEGQICDQVPKANETVTGKDELTISVTVCGAEDTLYMRNVESMDIRQALRILKDEMGLTVIQEQAPSDTITEGYVISYSPSENTPLQKGDEVTIVVSTGRVVKQVAVPDFTNMNIDQVESQLKSLGLIRGRIDYYYYDDIPEGRVTWQNISATKEVDEGTVIDFWVSRGPEESDPPETPPPASEPPVVDTAPPETPEPTPTPTPEPTPTPPPAEDNPSEPPHDDVIDGEDGDNLGYSAFRTFFGALNP